MSKGAVKKDECQLQKCARGVSKFAESKDLSPNISNAVDGQMQPNLRQHSAFLHRNYCSLFGNHTIRAAKTMSHANPAVPDNNPAMTVSVRGVIV